MSAATGAVDEPARGPSRLDWTGEAAERWLAWADRLEATIAPIDEVLLPAAAVAGGDRVLDVGCGRGATTRAVARAAGPSGDVVGVDIAPGTIAEAAALPIPEESAPVTWVTADAATHPFPDESFDVIVSRLGAIFFDDPVAAFANLLRATRAGGRLAIAVWLPRDASEFQSLAIDVAVRVAATLGVQLQPDAPDAGPYAYGVADHTLPILERAGWRDLSLTRHELTLHVGGAGTTPEEAAELGRTVGPLRSLLDGVESHVTDAVHSALLEELRDRWDGHGVAMTAAIAVVTARR